MKNVISHPLGLDLVNINVYAKFIKILHSVQETGLFLLFQNLNLGNASANPKWHLTIPRATSCQYHFNRIWRSAKPRPIINVILQFLELDLVNINVSANFYQNSPNDLRDKFHRFQDLDLGKTSTNPKCHLTISLATSCQYQCVCKVSSQFSTQFKR